ncbi:MAG TPA: zinc ribbon domain-containing protein [Marinagarivorans sp.]
MPIYEYQCANCGHELEALQKMSDAALSNCPQCNQESLRKKVSAAGFRLSGSGWYETDFKSGKKKNLAATGEKEKPAKSATETKPAATPAPKAAS